MTCHGIFDGNQMHKRVFLFRSGLYGLPMALMKSFILPVSMSPLRI